MRALKLAFFVGRCSGKRSFKVPEQFALDQIFRDRGTIHLNKSFVLAQALGVYGVSHEFLARSGFSIDQDAAVGRRHQANLLAQGLHRNAVAHDDAFRLQLFFQVNIFAVKFLGLDRVLHQE